MRLCILLIRSTAALAFATTALDAQQLNDVGLGIPAFGMHVGRICEPFTCTAEQGTLPAGGPVSLAAYGPPGTPSHPGAALIGIRAS